MIVYNYHLVNYNHQVMLEGGLPMSDKQTAAMLDKKLEKTRIRLSRTGGTKGAVRHDAGHLDRAENADRRSLAFARIIRYTFFR